MNKNTGIPNTFNHHEMIALFKMDPLMEIEGGDQELEGYTSWHTLSLVALINVTFFRDMIHNHIYLSIILL